jgi:hypothetical protein
MTNNNPTIVGGLAELREQVLRQWLDRLHAALPGWDRLPNGDLVYPAGVEQPGAYISAPSYTTNAGQAAVGVRLATLAATQVRTIAEQMHATGVIYNASGFVGHQIPYEQLATHQDMFDSVLATARGMDRAVVTPAEREQAATMAAPHIAGIRALVTALSESGSTLRPALADSTCRQYNLQVTNTTEPELLKRLATRIMDRHWPSEGRFVTLNDHDGTLVCGIPRVLTFYRRAERKHLATKGDASRLYLFSKVLLAVELVSLFRVDVYGEYEL